MTGTALDVVRYHAYIDEAGDEGLGKLKVEGVSGGQSRFFAIGAFLVDAVSDSQLPKWRDEAVKPFPQRVGRTLHFKELRNHEQKIAVCHSLSSKPFAACVVLSFKPTIVDSPKYQIFKQPQHLYNYLVRFTLERVTAAVRKRALQHGHKAALTVTFSRREGTDYEVMREYLQFLKDGKEVMPSIGRIDWSVFDPADIRVENHAVRAGLQLADVVTSATFAAFEPGFYGHCEEGYCHALRPRYIRNQGRTLNCGLTLIPPLSRNPMPEKQRAFAASFA
ncbi:Protein of unknown function [Devosia crocina]|uniref:DUF3800 domain-containing protein n=1 Tax=Devosia crocina TaxID=429728 RepID=A0A1I7NC43_9HYPH|nr:DUF3800 domain-containing protein [Devosia crocina]SFV32237.1 Protein of unknown function [Devosia crocina]